MKPMGDQTNSPDKYSGEWLREKISAGLDLDGGMPSDYWKPARNAWRRYVESANGEYDYDSCLEAYGDLTGKQMKAIEDFLNKNRTLHAAQNVARAAYDSVYHGDRYLNNLISLYEDAILYDCDSFFPEFSDYQYDTYRVACGITTDLATVTDDELGVAKAQSKLAFALFRADSSNRWIAWKGIEQTGYGHGSFIRLVDKPLRAYLRENPKGVDGVLNAAKLHPELESVALISLVSNESHVALVEGTL